MNTKTICSVLLRRRRRRQFNALLLLLLFHGVQTNCSINHGFYFTYFAPCSINAFNAQKRMVSKRPDEKHKSSHRMYARLLYYMHNIYYNIYGYRARLLERVSYNMHWFVGGCRQTRIVDICLWDLICRKKKTMYVYNIIRLFTYVIIIILVYLYRALAVTTCTHSVGTIVAFKIL